jgi:3-oxoacyl-[acyl-carrier protein] reductase
MKLKGVTAIVTGASTGIGRSIALAIAKEGGRVGLIGRSSEGLAHTLGLIQHFKGEARIFLADLRDAAAVERLAQDATSAWGDIDAVVNCAGVWHNSERAYYGIPLAQMTRDEIDEVLDVGTRAPLQLARLLLPGMIKRRRGKILNISGTFSAGGAGWLHYFVSKKALEAFTAGLADELRPHEIQVNCISPSDVQTDALGKYFPDDFKTALPPEEVARFAVFLLSGDADHITGAVIVIKNKITH